MFAVGGRRRWWIIVGFGDWSIRSVFSSDSLISVCIVVG
jgi:hypothetical protein